MTKPAPAHRPHSLPLTWLSRRLDDLIAAAAWLVLPLALLLCAQWPLRDWLHAWSREANDLAQLCFGLYVSVAITAASRQGSHLTPDAVARYYSPRLRSLIARCAALFIVLPWSLFVLVEAVPATWQAILQLEGFAETFNPGYFILRIAVCLLALLVALQAVIEVATGVTTPTDRPA
jgi:TRAP-type C4-dicarboxylate transport system permease small subunit